MLGTWVAERDKAEARDQEQSRKETQKAASAFYPAPPAQCLLHQ